MIFQVAEYKSGIKIWKTKWRSQNGNHKVLKKAKTYFWVWIEGVFWDVEHDSEVGRG